MAESLLTFGRILGRSSDDATGYDLTKTTEPAKSDSFHSVSLTGEKKVKTISIKIIATDIRYLVEIVSNCKVGVLRLEVIILARFLHRDK